MSTILKGPWDYPGIVNYLQQSEHPIRLSCLATDGFPRVVSLWYQFREPSLYCVSHRNSSLIRLLLDNPKVGFEVSPNSPPYFGLRGQGSAELHPLGEDPLLDELLQHYIGNTDSGFSQWLLSRREDEVIIRIHPRRLYSWDYRRRMAEV